MTLPTMAHWRMWEQPSLDDALSGRVYLLHSTISPLHEVHKLIEISRMLAGVFLVLFLVGVFLLDTNLLGVLLHCARHLDSKLRVCGGKQ